MSDAIDISVAVPAYNDAAKLSRLLDSFDRLEVEGRVEIIVVDDCSPDGTGEVVRAWMARPHPYETRYVRNERNSGPGKTRNRGLHEARGKYIAYTDSDCIVDPKWLVHLVRRIDPEHHIVGVGGHVEAVTEASMAARHYIFHSILEPPDALVYLVTCNCLFDRQALLDIGGFPEAVRAPGGEDVAIGIRLYKRGGRFAYAPDATIWHDFRHELSNFYKTWYNYGFGSAYYVHLLLTRDELYPERCNHFEPNWWSGHAIRPTISGFNTFLRDMRMEFGIARIHRLGPIRLAQMLCTRLIERIGYIRGWRDGRSRYFAESGRKPFYN